MGQESEKAIAELRAMTEVVRQAGFVERMMRAEAAQAAKEDGMTVREFAEAADLSRSTAGREFRASPYGYAVDPRNADTIEALRALAKRQLLHRVGDIPGSTGNEVLRTHFAGLADEVHRVKRTEDAAEKLKDAARRATERD